MRLSKWCLSSSLCVKAWANSAPFLVARPSFSSRSTFVLFSEMTLSLNSSTVSANSLVSMSESSRRLSIGDSLESFSFSCISLFLAASSLFLASAASNCFLCSPRSCSSCAFSWPTCAACWWSSALSCPISASLLFSLAVTASVTSAASATACFSWASLKVFAATCCESCAAPSGAIDLSVGTSLSIMGKKQSPTFSQPSRWSTPTTSEPQRATARSSLSWEFLEKRKERPLVLAFRMELSTRKRTPLEFCASMLQLLRETSCSE
mmetsp:Transcript_107777/g.286920  ORF Transcript_107777/g.286920 Transcript_107777/m.286920 type:complete len:265 (+) Transcript_107777:1216-2010(+)